MLCTKRHRSKGMQAFNFSTLVLQGVRQPTRTLRGLPRLKPLSSAEVQRREILVPDWHAFRDHMHTCTNKMAPVASHHVTSRPVTASSFASATTVDFSSDVGSALSDSESEEDTMSNFSETVSRPTTAATIQTLLSDDDEVASSET